MTLAVTAVIILPPAPAFADRIRDDQWHLRFLQISQAHQLSQGEGVIVAVPDTGVAPHPDLRNNLLPGMSALDGLDDGHHDSNGHGTAMAGLIAAHGKGTSGALGISPAAKILPITTTPAEHDGTPDHLAIGIEYAIQQGADIISISSVGGSSIRLQKAIESALQADIVVVAAAGNHPNDLVVGYPARLPDVLAVGGVDRQGNHASVSVTGREVDVVAPATDIYSTSFGNKYFKGTGTSSATAIVAGTAALIRARYPHLSANEVIHRLTATAIDKGPPGHDHEYGHGLIDPLAALTADVPPPADPTPTTAPNTSSPPTRLATDHQDDSQSSNPLLGIAGLAVAGGGVAWLIITWRRRHTTI